MRRVTEIPERKRRISRDLVVESLMRVTASQPFEPKGNSLLATIPWPRIRSS
jgi:hypothetical protein